MKTFNKFYKKQNNNLQFKKNINHLIYLSIFCIKHYSARHINYSNIIIKNLYLLMLLCFVVPIEIILIFCILICCCVNLYRLFIILTGLMFTKSQYIHKEVYYKDTVYNKTTYQDNCLKFNINVNININLINKNIFQYRYPQINNKNNTKSIYKQKNITTSNYENYFFNNDKNFPIYSILIPIYREIRKIEQIFKFIKMLDYPKDKLDVCILIEQDDFEIQQFLNNNTDLPFYINIILVPPFQPKTKPKALNYGINFIKGKYVVIYDADDIPDVLQLKKAIHLFNELSKKYICIQCRLNFYNATENIITTCMSTEYSTLFDFYLFGLEYFNLPILLGGTSNHFRVKELKKIGLWDSYNVTEDAELSIRIYSNKYKIAMLDSVTLEEAPVGISAFIKQRSRWIKGFLQTFFCYIVNLEYKKFNFSQIVFIIINLLFFSLSLFIGPILIILSLFLDIKLLGINFYIFITYHVLVSFITAKEKFFNYKYFFCFSFYYFLHMFAFILSIYDLLKQPFHWRKTDHGVSKMQIK